MKITLNTNYLAACLIVAPKKEKRIQLVSILLDFRHATNSLVYVATDGSIMACFRDDITYTEDAQTADYQLLIPRHVVETAVKGWQMPCITLESLPDGRYLLGDVVFSLHPHQYPDYRRVIPAAVPAVLPDGHGLDAELLSQAQKAMNRANGGKSAAQQAIVGGMSVMAYFSGNSQLVFVMPCRVSNAPISFEGFYAT